MNKANKKQDKRIKCIYCNKPIHIDNWAGVTKKGFVCANSNCLLALSIELEDEVKPKMSSPPLNKTGGKEQNKV